MNVDELNEVYDSVKMDVLEDARLFHKIAEKKQEQTNHKHFRFARVAAAVGVLCLAVPGTVYAASQAYHILIEQKGKYQTDMVVTREAESEVTAETAQAVQVNFGYIPDGMTLKDGEKSEICSKEGLPEKYYYYELYRMDTQNFTISAQDCAYINQVKFADCEGFLVEKNNARSHTDWRMYEVFLYYDKCGCVVKLNASGEVNEKEVTAVAKGLSIETGQGVSLNEAQAWSDYIQSTQELQNEYAEGDKELKKELNELKKPFHLDTSGNYKIGSTIHYDGYDVSLTEVDILDRDEGYLDEDTKNEVRSDGSLKDCVRRYYRLGDGVNTKDELVKTEHLPVKLVRVSLSYTNTANTVMDDKLVFPTIHMITQKENESRYVLDERKGADYCIDNSLCESLNFGEQMEAIYIDTSSPKGEKQDGDNYINALQPDESRQITVVFGVLEKDLGSMFLETEELPTLKSTDKFFDIRQ